ncbi:hypothetical protein LguiA_023599 [Lonicera macranthoides]
MDQGGDDNEKGKAIIELMSLANPSSSQSIDLSSFDGVVLDQLDQIARALLDFAKRFARFDQEVSEFTEKIYKFIGD